jgi:molybdopterin-biosynthesis enzyme MoeA-like protein
MAVVGDEVDAIVSALGWCRQAARYVVTSGGVGPTHDDVTIRAVSLALGRDVVRDPELVDAVRSHYGEPPPEAALRLAEVPRGAELIRRAGTRFPVVACDGVFMLPGVPQLFQIQLEAVLERVPGGVVHTRCLFLRVGEPEIAAALDRIALAAPHVAIGSYPTFDVQLDYKVKLTVEHAQAAEVDRIVAELLAALPPESVVRVE